MIKPTISPVTADNSIATFWQRILSDGSFDCCDNLEKLVAGCEIIAALDDLDLLAAA
ncbi:MAG: hypothetical protein H0V56_05635 [Chthoniobacterales bacterium]|nr:hypothetical protein [Chthoniobacterales bacterium]